jgi:hypothetical protein
MSLRGVAAVVGLAERAPQRYTENETNLDLLSGVAVDAMADAGIDRSEVDGLLVHPIGGLPAFVPATVAEFVGLRPRFAELVDLGGATGAGPRSGAGASAMRVRRGTDTQTSSKYRA